MDRSEKRIHDNKIRRKKELRKKVILAFLTMGIVTVLFFTANSFLSIVKASDEAPAYKCYKSVLVEAGDTLWSIASNNMGTEYESTDSYVKEVKNMNHLSDDDITAGNYLIVPYYCSQSPEF